MKVALHECITIIIIKLTLFIFTLYFSPIEVKEKNTVRELWYFFTQMQQPGENFSPVKITNKMR